MFAGPPNLQNANGFLVGGAAGAIVTTANIVASPGVGSRIRVWAWGFGWWRSNAAGLMVGRLRDGAGAVFDSMSLQVGASDFHNIPGGFHLTVNTDLRLIAENAVVGQSQYYEVFYTIERHA